jgi:uncharacterized protein YjbJ (UPF0337 family)
MRIANLVLAVAFLMLSSLAIDTRAASSRLAPTQENAMWEIPGWSDPLLVLVLNQDQFKGNWKQFKGELKQKWGQFTDDDLLYIEGSYDKYEGKLQERYGDRKAEVKQWTDEWFKQHPYEPPAKHRAP